MLDTDTKRRIDTCRDILVGKVPDPKSQVEQITIALIYKFMDDMDADAIEMDGKPTFFTKDFERYRWAKLVAPGVSGQDMLNTYSEALTNMVQNEGLPKLFRDIFRNAYLPYRDPETLRAFLREIDTFTYDHSEKLGDAFEYLLSVLGSQGDAGQFRTPRHIIDFIVEIIDPQKTEVIMDPACGTAGFLISAYKHILKQNSTGVVNGNGAGAEGDATDQALESPMRYPGDLLQPEDRARLARNIKGYDISPDMVRLSLVNLYLHGFADPKVEEYDTLTSEDKWTETADVILANPPFMSPKGGIKPHTRFQVHSKRSEVLFVDYIAEHLTPNGRAAIVVPEGIIFQSQSAYVALRKMLVENHLAAVISLPAGVFNPYSGVKTSILILDRAVAKASKHVAFFKIENDGFALGAQRKAVKGSQLAQVKAELEVWLHAARAGGGEGLESSLGSAVERERLAEGGDYNLSGERYTEKDARQSLFPIVSLGEIAEVVSGQSPDGETVNDSGQGVPFHQGKTDFGDRWILPPRKWTTAPTKFAEPNDILMSVRAPVGPVNLTSYRMCVGRGLAAIRPSERVDGNYLFAILRSAEATIVGQSGAAFAAINRKDVEAIPIPLPPLEVQREIVAEVEGYQRVIDGARAVLDNYRPHIPADPEWPIMRLAEAPLEIIDGDRGANYPSKEDFTPTGHCLFLSTANVRPDGFLFERLEFISEGKDAALRKGKLVRGDVVLTTRGTIGNTGIYDGSVPYENVRINSGMLIFRPDRDKLESGYLFAFFQSENFVMQRESVASGSAQPQLPIRSLNTISIPIPPVETQQAIVAEIETEQALVNGNRDLIARFERKIDAAIARVWGEAKAEGEA
ncbi:N-6 DNA methylase [Seohaeicola nanhaiensis]|uniref:site-specific DNA-methyltransferase (adenine-specific) n=1 Tax=Seohaeicola nanhaiensis TaxID=1387282 RepID=A0ABV9KP89_9RHOB